MSNAPAALVIDAATGARQHAAGDPATSAWVTANAGSGKTFVLTRRVLRLLLAGADPGAVLCLTFTNAAAAQMATRVFEQLAGWAQCDDAELADALAGLLGRPPDDAEKALARRLFARAIETPGRLKIQTVHAFCESLLQRFAIEAQVPRGFSVLDEDMAEALLETALRDVLAAPDTPELQQALASLSAMLDPNALTKTLKQVVDKRHAISAWAGQGAGFGLASVRRHVARVIGVDETATAEGIAAEILGGDILPRSEWASIAQTLAQYPQSATTNTVNCLMEVGSAADDHTALSAYTLVFLRKDGVPRARLLNKDAETGEPVLVERLETERDRVLPLFDALKGARLLGANVDLARTGDAVIDRYTRLKTARGVLDYADLIARARSLLQHSPSAAWVLYKLDPGLDHILVDEAQDTSPEQWAVIGALCEEFFAGSGARKQPRTVFAVGDPKQSIYSFQGADPAGFTAMRRHFARQLGEAAGGTFTSIRLDRSFRSAPAVLEAVDRVFAGAPARHGVALDDDPVAHTAARETAPGRVELWDPVPSPELPDHQPWTAPLDAARPDSAENKLAHRIAADIARMIADKEVIAATGRPASAGDVLILLRSRKRLATPIIRALKAHGVPVAGADRLHLTQSIATMDLMALMRAGLMPDDDHSLACALKSPLFDLTDDHLMAIAIDRPGSLAEALGGHRGDAAIETAAGRFADWARAVRRLRPFDLLCRILGADGGRQAYRARLGNEADDVLDELADRALAFERDHVPTIAGFLDWLERSSGEIKRDLAEGEGAVRVMTVHGAKGLEAPVVYLADTLSVPDKGRLDTLSVVADDDVFAPPRAVAWRPRADDETEALGQLRDAAHAAQIAEYHRLLYVAMTRAQDRLVICGAMGKRNQVPDGCWYALAESALAERLKAITEDVRYYRPDAPGTPVTTTERSTQAPLPAALPPWAHAPMTSRPAPEQLAASQMAASQIGGTTAVATSPSAGSPGRGTLMHLLLQHLPDVDPARRDAAGRALLARNAPDWTEADRSMLVAQATATIDAPALAALFSGNARAEVPVAGMVRKVDEPDAVPIAIAGRIDRLLIEESRVLIADFKSGTVPERLQDTPAPYVMQLAAYRALLGAVFPDKRVETALIWTDAPGGPEVTRFDEALVAGFEAIHTD